MSKIKANVEKAHCGQGICIIHVEDIDSTNFIHFSDLSNPEHRFQSICNIKEQRLSQPICSPQRQQSICDQIPNHYEENHGYHRQCYQRFTMNLHRLQIPTTTVASEDLPIKRARRCPSAEKDKILFKPDCIFCGKEGRKKVQRKCSWTTEGLFTFAHGGGDSILKLAEARGDEDLARRIHGVDLFACGAKYHVSCRKNYCDRSTWQSTNEGAKHQMNDLEEAHNTSFSQVCEVIDQKIIAGKEVMKMTDLRDLYIEYLAKTPFANPNYKTQTLKRRLLRHGVYGIKLSFVNLGRTSGKLQSELVYNNETDVASAVKHGYLLGCADMVQDVATLLRQIIMNAYAKSETLPWPPTASYLQSVEDPVPKSLQRFLRVLISGQDSLPASDRSERLISSIGQDLCRAATNGNWKLPKHILLCMTLRHLFRSAKLNTLMNRLGHAESYSFSLELETALAVALEEAATLITPQIIQNPTVPSLFHSDFDNFDQLVNDLSGSGSIHTAHGIMLQTVQVDDKCTVPSGRDSPVVQSVPKTGERSLKSAETDSLPPCYINQRNCPKMKVNRWSLPGSDEVVSDVSNMNRAWCIIRQYAVSTMARQIVPGWCGFISETGTVPTALTTIDYYPVINNPITEYATVKECLRMSKKASEDVGQRYAITTFDLGVCMKAYPVIWKSPDYYKDHIVMIGSFHLACAYLKMIGKKISGSGFTEILLESGLMSTGSMKGVLSGKNYSRAIYCHKAMAEGFERLLLNKFHSTKGSDQLFDNFPADSLEKVNILLDARTKENLEVLLNDTAFHSYLNDYSDFRLRVSNGELGKTAQFWLSYMDHVWLLLSLLNAVKTNNYYLYAACLNRMADLFFSFDGQNYARYLTYFSVFLANIEESHPGATELIKLGAISVARSFVPGNLCAVDKTIETFMKHAKSHAGAGGSAAGLSGILNNYDAYRRWAKTAHERARYVETMLQVADMTDETDRNNKHRDVRPSQVRKSEAATVNVMESVESFMNPFSLDCNDKLFRIASGAPAPPHIQTDIMAAESIGKLAKENFIRERLERDTDLFEPIKRQRLKTFSDMTKCALVKTSKNREIEYRQQGNIAFQLLVLSQNQPKKLDIAELLHYPLMPVPSSIGTADGYLLKTDKSKGFHYLTKGMSNADAPSDQKTLNIEDGNATFYCMKEVPGTFKQISQKLFDIGTVGKSSVIFSTDMYKENSIKSMERASRGSAEKRIIKGENTKKPENWKEFLSNSENKQQLVQLMLKVWGSDAFISKLLNKMFIAICEGKAYKLTSIDGNTVLMSEIESLESDQEETDTRVILYCAYAAKEGYEFVRIRSPDSDVFFILLYYAQILKTHLLFDTGSGNKRQLLDISKLAKDFTPPYCSALLGLHAFTKCDTTSAFRGIGKVKPIKLLQKQPRYQEAFQSLGESWNITEDLFLQLEDFTCRMYKSTPIVNVDALRFAMLMAKCGDAEKRINSKKNVDLSTLPPPRVCLREHIKRVNYQVAIWKRSHVPKPYIPKSTENHGWIVGSERLEPKWCDGEILPSMLVDILEKECEKEENTREDSSTDEDSDNDAEDSADDSDSD